MTAPGSAGETQPIDDGGQAFPCSATESDTGQDGMTLRDYFAAKALQGFCAAPDERVINGGTPEQVAAKRWEWAMADAQAAYRLADAMIQTRKGGS